MRWGYSFVLAALLAWSAHAQEPKSEIREFDIATLEELGRQMYVQDLAAWRGTDALMAKYSQATLQAEKVRGWIVVDKAEGPLVRFIRDGDAGPEAAYDINDPLERPVVSVPADRHLSETEKALFAARSLAIANIATRCSQTYNTIVLKDPKSSGWLAWTLASTTKDGEIAMGIHYRFTISPDGKAIDRRDALLRSCFIMEKSKDDKGKPEAVVMTQLVSNLPVETYVFLSLQHSIPIYVMTPDRVLWAVEGDKIRQIETKPESGKP